MRRCSNKLFKKFPKGLTSSTVINFRRATLTPETGKRRVPEDEPR
jgi:hypothetical protein